MHDSSNLLRRALSVTAILVATILAQTSTGINSVLWPVALQGHGHSNTLIGISLSLEIVAVIMLSSYITWLISRIGMALSIYIAGILRALAIIGLTYTENYYLWCIGIFIYGISTYTIIIALQTWLNTLTFERYKGLIIGFYSAAISLGVALGPVVLRFIDPADLWPVKINAGIALSAIAPLVIMYFLIPKITTSPNPRVAFTVKLSPAVMFSALAGGVTFFGLPAFLTLFGMKNGLELGQASLLITAFMLGSISVGLLISLLSDFIDRRYVIIVCFFVGLLCAVYLSMAIYNYHYALALLFVWGGVAGGIYAVGLTIIGERFREEDQVSANTAYALMDSIGGAIGVNAIGFAMDMMGSEGLAYVIVTVAVSYFIFALSRYRIN
jgi:MFS family permease